MTVTVISFRFACRLSLQYPPNSLCQVVVAVLVAVAVAAAAVYSQVESLYDSESSVLRLQRFALRHQTSNSVICFATIHPLQ